MKNKKTLYFLIPAVVIVWGLIVYKIYQGIGSDDSYYNTPLTYQTTQSNIKEDTSYVLLIDYKDPFFTQQERNTSTHAVQRTSTSFYTENTKPKRKIDWTGISFLGVIQKSKSKEMIALISVNGKSHMAKKGDKIESFVVKKILKDSILIEKEAQKTFIKKRK